MINITGKWENQFGSLMEVTELNAASGIFSGTYASTTGTSGTYRVTGVTDISPDPQKNSQTIAFAVSWRDIGGNPADANWVSAFAGQVQLVNGEQVMTTTYLLQQNTDPSDNWAATAVFNATYQRPSADKAWQALPTVGQDLCVTFPLAFGRLSDDGATPWVSPLGLGTPAQTLRFMIDSGTDNTWVTSIRCITEACLAHGRFDAAESQTYRELDSTPSQRDFGPWGSMTVVTGSDVFTLAQTSSRGRAPLLIGENMHFESAIDYTGPQFQQLACDGGIAIPSPFWNKEGTTEALMLQLLRDSKIAYPLAAFWTDSELGQGECVFGAVDVRKFQPGTLQWMPLIKTGVPDLDYLWPVTLNDFLVEGTPVPAGITSFVLDSGSSCFKGPQKLIDALLRAVTMGGKLPTRVSSTSELKEYPVIDLSFGRTKFHLEPRQYFLKLNEKHWELGIQVLDGMPQGMLLVGSVFLDTVYCIFDYDGKRVGLAEPA